MKAIFIVGEQRSGSNLLRLMLSQAGVAAPHPPHILKRMLPLEQSYGSLETDESWSQLVEDVCRLVDRNPVTWMEVYPLDRDEVARRCRERSTVAIFGAIMDMYAHARGATAWACKSMQYSQYADTIEHYFTEPLYLYLYRDVRDVSLSFNRAVVGEKHPYFFALRWARLQRAANRVGELVGPERLFPICYEELISNPEPLLRAMCTFLGVDFEPRMMEFHRSSDAKSASGSSQLWENVGRPLMSNNARKFLRGLTEEQIRLCESVAGAEMDRLGYDRVHVPIGSERVYGVDEVRSFEEENERLKKEKRSLMDAEDAARRKHQMSVLTERVQYLEGMGTAQLIELLQYMEEDHIAEGTVFVEQGDFGDCMYFIVDGMVEVIDGDTVESTLELGACVGEVGLVASLPRTRTLRAASKVRLLRLTNVEMQQMMRQSPELASQLLWQISGQLAARFSTVVC